LYIYRNYKNSEKEYKLQKEYVFMKKMFLLLFGIIICFSITSQDNGDGAFKYQNDASGYLNGLDLNPPPRAGEQNIPYPNTTIRDAGRLVGTREEEVPDYSSGFNDLGPLFFPAYKGISVHCYQ
jgi:hypothetical protein